MIVLVAETLDGKLVWWRWSTREVSDVVIGRRMFDRLRGRKTEFIGCARSCIQCPHTVDERGVRSVQTKVTGSQQSQGVRNVTDAKHVE